MFTHEVPEALLTNTEIIEEANSFCRSKSITKKATNKERDDIKQSVDKTNESLLNFSNNTIRNGSRNSASLDKPWYHRQDNADPASTGYDKAGASGNNVLAYPSKNPQEMIRSTLQQHQESTAPNQQTTPYMNNFLWDSQRILKGQSVPAQQIPYSLATPHMMQFQDQTAMSLYQNNPTHHQMYLPQQSQFIQAN